MSRYINHGSFGIHGRRISLLASRATGVFVADDYLEGKRRRHKLRTTDLNEAKKMVAELIEQIENGRPVLSSQGETVLYVIQRGGGGPIKVGISRRLKSRISQLQNGSAEKLHVLRVYKMADVEKAVHAALEKQSRLEGEWFPADLLSSVDRFFNVAADVAFQRAQNSLFKKGLRKGLQSKEN
jgi:Meiotically up-regulated gene 113